MTTIERPAAFVSAATLLLVALPVLAHTDAGSVSGFASGFLHPVSGLDHVAAMAAVGLWGAFLGQPAIWLLPVVFPMVMALGGVLGIAGIPVPGVEILIALSGMVLGSMVVFRVKPPIAVAAALVGLFAIFHGHAHGMELPGAASPLGYSAGFVICTGLIHLSGIAFGLLTKWKKGEIAVRILGGVIVLAGAYFLVNSLR